MTNYTPTRKEVKKLYTAYLAGKNYYEGEADFDRWFLQEIERAEYSGYLRAVREGLHR